MSVEGTGAEAPAAEEGQTTEAVENQSVEQTEQTETDQFSKKFAALSRREKDIRTKEQEYEQKLADLQAKYEAVAPKQEEVNNEEQLPLEYRLKRNPLKTLEELGFGYEKLTELALNDGKLPPEMQMKLMREELESDYKKKFEALEEKLTAKELQEQELKRDVLNAIPTM